MKLIYLANIRLPTERAHGIQIMKTCEALKSNGVDVTLVVPNRTNRFAGDPFKYYHLKERFGLKMLLCLDPVYLGAFGFRIQTFSFAISAAIYAMFRKDVIFYTRDEPFAYLLAKIGKEVYWEGHQGRDNFFTRFLIKKRVRMILISNGLKAYYLRKGARGNDILVASDGVDIDQFYLKISKEEARKKVGLLFDKKIVVYTGHLYDWKGADILAEAAKVTGNTEFVFVGGADEDIASFSSKYSSVPNIKIIGRRPHEEIPFFLKAADVLVLPNSGRKDISRLYTSPMKLFEYMASGVPIIASDLPSICEVLNEKNAVLVESDNAPLLAVAIENILSNPDLAQEIAEQALSDVVKYGWLNRALAIGNFIDSQNENENSP